MRCKLGEVEHAVVQRDRLNGSLERIRRSAGAEILRSWSFSAIAGADEERHRLGRIDLHVARWHWRGPVRARRRRGIAIAIATRVYPETHITVLVTGHRYVRCGARNNRHHRVERRIRRCAAGSDGDLPMVGRINIERKASMIDEPTEHDPIGPAARPAGLYPGFQCELAQVLRILRAPRNADVTSVEIDAGWQILASGRERVAWHNRTLPQSKRWRVERRRLLQCRVGRRL